MTDTFVAIIGTQSSGSSAIAGVAYHLGLWLGDKLGGRYGRDPENKCGFEDIIAGLLCVKHCPVLTARLMREQALSHHLAARVHTLQSKAAERGTIAGVKHPRLSRMGRQFVDICGDGLKVINCDRPLEDSIASIKRRQPDNENAAAIQRWLWSGKQQFLALVPAERQLTVSYYELLADVETQAARIAAFLGLHPTAQQMEKAKAIVHPEMQHIGRKEVAA